MLFETYPNIFINNKYLTWYEKLTSAPSLIGAVEKHHIVPKSILKNNTLVSLSLRQHYIAHLLLVKCVHPTYRRKMLYAVTAMKMHVTKGIQFNSRIFEKLKIEANLQRSLNLIGTRRSPETRAKIKAKRALQVITEETKVKMSASHKGMKNSTSSIEKTRQAHLGSTRSETTKQKLKESRKYYPKHTCQHCGITVVTVNYNRWHGNNCKMRTQ